MYRVAVALVLAGSLTACAGSPIGDALAGPEALAQRDDAYCQSIGATYGTPSYTQCRMFATQQREAGHRARFQQAATNLAIQQAAQPRTVNCTSSQMGIYTNTRCY